VTLGTLSFTERWEQSAAAERANYQLFLSELCDFLDLPRPDPTRAEDALNTYVFEKSVTFRNFDGTTSQGRIDLYRKGHFVLEAKQGSNPPELQTHSESSVFALTPPTPRPVRQRRGTAVRGTHGWDEAMLNAYNQAERYAKGLPPSEGWPPFLITVDVGHSIELFADFSLTGKAYLPFPDARSYRISLSNLGIPEIRERLRSVWTDPHSLNPARHAAKVTREVAAKLAVLARTLEQKYSAKQVAEFLTRCIFTSFAEDVKLLPEKSWYNLLCELRDSDNVGVFPEMAQSLWNTMNAGGFSPILRAHVLRFNGGLFESTEALPLTGEQLALLIDAADSNWKDVEPAIFGTLLERALNPVERHQLGAHYTPRAYVERLVIPTIVEPLRADWADVIAAVSELVTTDHPADAIDILRDFHLRLCNTRVLDPACGSGNFLYVALEHMKRLEGEILETLVTLGETQQALEHTGLTVNPHQLLGIDINPRATAVADLVLWIGYLQWHFRTRGDSNPPIPVINSFHNIANQDALMSYDQKVPAVDDHGQPISEWDRVTFSRSAITGRKIPDQNARRPVFSYPNARKMEWPDAEFIIGNPPFIGKGKLIKDLGEGYIKTLRATYRGEVPDGSDFVMYWWKKGAQRVAAGLARRSGLISTNSISQVFNSRVVAEAMSAEPGVHLAFAIPDHPWVDNEDGAAIRIAMTVLAPGQGDGTLASVIDERPNSVEPGLVDVSLRLETGLVHRNLTVGVDVTSAKPLRAAKGIAGTGLILGSRGFVLSEAEAASFGDENREVNIVHPLYTGSDVTDRFYGSYVVDTASLDQHGFREGWPRLYQFVLDRVLPDRDVNRDSKLRKNWWLFRRSNRQVRTAINGLQRYIVTPETSKHRFFVFLSHEIRPEHGLVVIGSEDAYHLGILSSRVHLIWTANAGGTLEDRPRYNKTVCFDRFPFPASTEAQQQNIRAIAERLDSHRKHQQQVHPELTLTDMYNVLEKLGDNGELTPQERVLYDAGLVGILREIHGELDRAVFDAYGWAYDLSTDELLARIVALNFERRTEEKSGLVRWLRPNYQAPHAVPVTGVLEGLVEEAPAATRRRKQTWPDSLPEQVRAIKGILRGSPVQTAQQVASEFRPARRARVTEILATLVALGQARVTGDHYSL
jgi:hypothetical protein